MGAIDPADGKAILVVVRRGAAGRFATLHAALDGDNGVAVVWDRRQSERRKAPAATPRRGERRLGERRGATPASWILLDFVVVPRQAAPPP